VGSARGSPASGSVREMRATGGLTQCFDEVARKQGARPFFSSHNCISQFTLILHSIFFIIQNIELICSDRVLAVVLNFEWMKMLYSYGQY
jgi:hypothetical protein